MVEENTIEGIDTIRLTVVDRNPAWQHRMGSLDKTEWSLFEEPPAQGQRVQKSLPDKGGLPYLY